VVLGSTVMRAIVEEQISCVCGWIGLGYSDDLCPRCGSSQRIEYKTFKRPSDPNPVIDLDALEAIVVARQDVIEGYTSVTAEQCATMRDAYVGATQPATVFALLTAIREMRAGLRQAADYLEGAGFFPQARRFHLLAAKEITRAQ
jgi:hypothetical protein